MQPTWFCIAVCFFMEIDSRKFLFTGRGVTSVILDLEYPHKSISGHLTTIENENDTQDTAPLITSDLSMNMDSTAAPCNAIRGKIKFKIENLEHNW